MSHNNEKKIEEEEKAIDETIALEAEPPNLEEEIAVLRDQLLRQHAELENIRKRAMREMEKARSTAIENFARDLLGVLDDIRRAEKSFQKAQLEKVVKQGLDLIISSAEQMLARHNIRKIEAKGVKFDPNIHEALFEDNKSTQEVGTITQIIEEGYFLGERLLRPARVGVATAPDKEN